MNRHQEAARKRHDRKAYTADPLDFAVALIKEHGAEKARPLFIARVAEFDGPEWAEQAHGLFDDLAVPVAAGKIEVSSERGGELPQELAKAIIAGDIPSNANKPGIARDMLMAAIKPATKTLQ